MMEINPENCERMWVGADPEHYSYKRYVIAKCKNGYIAVSKSDEEAFLNGYVFRTQIWKCAKPIKLTAIVKSAEEILQTDGVISFKQKYENTSVAYSDMMSNLAGKRIDIIECPRYPYDYTGAGHDWLKSWLKYFEGE